MHGPTSRSIIFEDTWKRNPVTGTRDQTHRETSHGEHTHTHSKVVDLLDQYVLYFDPCRMDACATDLREKLMKVFDILYLVPKVW